MPRKKLGPAGILNRINLIDAHVSHVSKVAPSCWVEGGPAWHSVPKLSTGSVDRIDAYCHNLSGVVRENLLVLRRWVSIHRGAA